MSQQQTHPQARTDMQNASEGGQNHQSEPQRRTNQQLQPPFGCI